MKIKQDRMEFEPILVVLETRKEAEAFLGMVDRCEFRTNDERILVTKLSNAFTNMEINY